MTSRSRSGRGMQKNVEIALRHVHIDDERPPGHVELGACRCSGARAIGTDQNIPGLRARGLAFGRMVDFCQRCFAVFELWQGPKMLTRDDLEGPNRIVFFQSRGSRKPTPRAASA